MPVIAISKSAASVARPTNRRAGHHPSPEDDTYPRAGAVDAMQGLLEASGSPL